MGFELTSDLEVYCYLKISLPHGFSVVAEPRAAYYSEWLFHYKIYHGDTLYREFQGDFRSLEAGSLVKSACQLLQEARSYAC
jgi:hypothetical protein